MHIGDYLAAVKDTARCTDSQLFFFFFFCVLVSNRARIFGESLFEGSDLKFKLFHNFAPQSYGEAN